MSNICEQSSNSLVNVRTRQVLPSFDKSGTESLGQNLITANACWENRKCSDVTGRRDQNISVHIGVLVKDQLHTCLWPELDVFIICHHV